MCMRHCTLRQKGQHKEHSPPQATRWEGQTYKPGMQSTQPRAGGPTFVSHTEIGGRSSGTRTTRGTSGFGAEVARDTETSRVGAGLENLRALRNHRLRA